MRHVRRDQGAAVGVAILGILLLGFLPVSCTCDLDEEEYIETSHSEFDWAPGVVVVVANRRGDLEIEEAPAGERPRLEARKRIVAPTDEEERELAALVRVDAVRTADTLRFEVQYPESRLTDSRVMVVGREMRRPRARVDLRISLPSSAKVRHITRSGDLRSERYTGTLEFVSTSGDAFLDDWRGDIDLTTRSGDASIGRVSGALIMRTASGDLVAQEVGGALTFEATSGDLEVSRIGGALKALTASGDLEISELGGGLEVRTTSGDLAVLGTVARGDVETSSGDIQLDLRSPEGRMRVRSASGDIDIHLMPPYPGRLEANTASGGMDLQVDMQIEVAERNRVSGRLAAGPQELVLTTATGDISVSGKGGGDDS